MMPPVIEKRRYRIGWLFLGLVFAGWFIQYLVSVAGFFSWWALPFPLIPIGGVAVGSAFGIALRVRERRLKKAVKAAHYQICTNCLYNLEGHESLGICPECGTPFTARKLEEDWRDFTEPFRNFWRFP